MDITKLKVFDLKEGKFLDKFIIAHGKVYKGYMWYIDGEPMKKSEYKIILED